MRVFAIALLLCASLATAQNQPAPAKPAAKPAANMAAKKPVSATRSQCITKLGFCLQVPGAWVEQEGSFGELGFVVAEARPGAEKDAWPQISVAAIDVPEQRDSARPVLDEVMELALKQDDPSVTAVTEQRSRLLLNGSNVQMVRVRLHDEKAQTERIEEVTFIEGDGWVFAIALRCTAPDLERADALYQKAVRSWKLTPPPEEKAPAAKDPEKK